MLGRKHALRNALLPIVTVIGLRLRVLFTGSVVIETVFAWPGIGRLMYEAIIEMDYPVLMGGFIMVSLVVVIANIITDLIYLFIDPRIRFQWEKENVSQCYKPENYSKFLEAIL